MNSWHQMTWEEVGCLPAQGMDAAMLPVGATEQHGPHMGCGMDAEIAFQLCRAVADETEIAVLPTLPYGCSLGHSKRWPGTLALQPKTLIDVVKDIGDWFMPLVLNGCLLLMLISLTTRHYDVHWKCYVPSMMT